MLKPMPSPRGTNREHRFIIDRSPRAAYDAAISDETAIELLEFVRDKLSPEDHAKLAEMLGAGLLSRLCGNLSPGCQLC